MTCTKTFTGYPWPTAYWNCVSPSDGRPAQDAQTLIQPSYQTQLTNNSALLYVFLDNAHGNSFFNWSIPDPVAGVTFAEGATLPNTAINVSVLQNTVFPGTGSGPLSDNQIKEVTSHELGHAIDFSGGIAGETSGSTQYATAITDDQNFLNNAGQPCQTGGTGPFNGLVDPKTNAQFCSNGGAGAVLNNPGGIYTGKTNSQIAAISQPGILAANNETFAQAFAYQDYVRTLPNQTGFFLTNVANGLFQKGFYQCAQAVGALGAGVAYGTPSYSCN